MRIEKRSFDTELRDYVENVKWELQSEQITVRQAGDKLNAAGVPFEVACRAVKDALAQRMQKAPTTFDLAADAEGFPPGDFTMCDLAQEAR